MMPYYIILLPVIFTARRHSAVYAVVVCLSVCLSQVSVLLKRLNIGSRKQRHTIAQVWSPLTTSGLKTDRVSSQWKDKLVRELISKEKVKKNYKWGNIQCKQANDIHSAEINICIKGAALQGTGPVSCQTTDE